MSRLMMRRTATAAAAAILMALAASAQARHPACSSKGVVARDKQAVITAYWDYFGFHDYVYCLRARGQTHLLVKVDPGREQMAKLTLIRTKVTYFVSSIVYDDRTGPLVIVKARAVNLLTGRASPLCPTKNIVIQNGQAVIADVRPHYVYCVRSKGKTEQLDYPNTDPISGPFALAGTWAAVVQGPQIHVYDLTEDVPDTFLYSDPTYGSFYDGDRVDALVLTSNVVPVAQETISVTDLDLGTTIVHAEIKAYNPSHPNNLLDVTGPGELANLAAHGNVVTWTHDGQPRSATIPAPHFS